MTAQVVETSVNVTTNSPSQDHTHPNVYVDFPDEIRHRRKTQWPRMKKAREEGKTAFFSNPEPDKLFIDGELIPL